MRRRDLSHDRASDLEAGVFPGDHLGDGGAHLVVHGGATQALLAAKAGATFISPFVGRIDDTGADGMELISEIRTIYDNYDYPTQILAASIRNAGHVRDAAIAGADCATIPPAVLKSLYKHVLTDMGLEAFLKDWKSTGQSIL